jgi:hypothetical protein
MKRGPSPYLTNGSNLTTDLGGVTTFSAPIVSSATAAISTPTTITVLYVPATVTTVSHPDQPELTDDDYVMDLTNDDPQQLPEQVNLALNPISKFVLIFGGCYLADLKKLIKPELRVREDLPELH